MMLEETRRSHRKEQFFQGAVQLLWAGIFLLLSGTFNFVASQVHNVPIAWAVMVILSTIAAIAGIASIGFAFRRFRNAGPRC